MTISQCFLFSPPTLADNLVSYFIEKIEAIGQDGPHVLTTSTIKIKEVPLLLSKSPLLVLWIDLCLALTRGLSPSSAFCSVWGRESPRGKLPPKAGVTIRQGWCAGHRFCHAGPLSTLAGAALKSRTPSSSPLGSPGMRLGEEGKGDQALVSYLPPRKVTAGCLWPWLLHPASILLGQWPTWLHFLPHVFFCSIVNNSEKPEEAELSKK